MFRADLIRKNLLNGAFLLFLCSSAALLTGCSTSSTRTPYTSGTQAKSTMPSYTDSASRSGGQTTSAQAAADADPSSSAAGISSAVAPSADSSSAQTADSAGKRATVTDIRMPADDGPLSYTNDDGTICLNITGADSGYVRIRYDGAADIVQLQVTNPDGSIYPYPLRKNSLETFPLTGGDGEYIINVLEHVRDDQYAIGLSQNFVASIADSLLPYLYPNEFASYTADSQAVLLGQQLSEESTDDLDYISRVYSYIISNVSYDNELAANLPVNYLPTVDATLESKKGICFDYAALMTAMLRSQDIPTRLEVGYSGTVYHSWISVWTEETGWIDSAIQFNGEGWTLMDPTLGASNDNASVKQYVGDGSNYVVKYHY